MRCLLYTSQSHEKNNADNNAVQSSACTVRASEGQKPSSAELPTDGSNMPFLTWTPIPWHTQASPSGLNLSLIHISPSSCHQAASPESKRFPDPMQLPRKDNTAPLSSWGYPPHGGPHGTQKRRSRKNASSASTAPSRAATALPAIRQPERNTANGRLPAFRKCPPDLPSPATPARGGC